MIKDESGQATPVPMQLWNSPDSRQPSNIYVRIRMCLKISKAFSFFIEITGEVKRREESEVDCGGI